MDVLDVDPFDPPPSKVRRKRSQVVTAVCLLVPLVALTVTLSRAVHKARNAALAANTI